MFFVGNVGETTGMYMLALHDVLQQDLQQGSRSDRRHRRGQLSGDGVWEQDHVLVFFFNVTAPTEIYTLSRHDALPI